MIELEPIETEFGIGNELYKIYCRVLPNTGVSGKVNNVRVIMFIDKE